MQLSKKQESEISNLRDKLKQLQVENTSSDSENDIRKRIELEEQEKVKIVEAQRKLESEWDSLKEELEEKESVRIQLERKRKKIEDETRKLQQLHKVQVERLKARLINAKGEEEKLEQVLDEKIHERQRMEDDIFELRRDEGIE